MQYDQKMKVPMLSTAAGGQQVLLGICWMLQAFFRDSNFQIQYEILFTGLCSHFHADL